MQKLLLASKSIMRHQLLREAKIPFIIIEQNLNEQIISWNQEPAVLVEKLAILKMENTLLSPDLLSLNQEKDIIFVLTADTIGTDFQGNIHGKPVDKDDAKKKLRSLENGFVYTGYCLEKKHFKNFEWHTMQRLVNVIKSEYTFYVPDNALEEYWNNTSALMASGGIAIEGYGLQFLKNISGSYSAILGLPMFELRQDLVKIGFF